MNGRALLRALAREAPAPFEAAGRSHVGKVRQINEDRFLVRSERGLWAVADGMGGHSAGGEAADAAIEELAGLADSGHAMSEAAIRSAFVRANRRIHQQAHREQAVSGTTLVAAWLVQDRLAVFWVGDSRAYRLRGTQIQRLTRDHSVVQELVDAGEIAEADAERHPHAHLITRALGAAETVEIDQIETDFAPGDRLLLCSDGVSRSLGPAAAVGAGPDIAVFADGILRGALDRDGRDNATLVAVQSALLPPA